MAAAAQERDRPIIMSAPMVRALLAGTKTQTRRVLPEALQRQFTDVVGDAILRRFPHQRGIGWDAYSRLWVKEETRRAPDLWTYAADGAEVEWPGREAMSSWARDVGGAMFLPRAASRLTLIVESVRVERLAEISREDAIAEGATCRPNCSGFRSAYDGWSMDWSPVGKPSRWAANGKTLSESDIALGSPQTAFGSFINDLHDPRWNLKGDGIFGVNPWCCALTFRVVPQNIDNLTAPLAQGASA